MRRTLSIIFLIFFDVSISYSQMLSTHEVSEYLTEYITQNLDKSENLYGGKQSIKITTHNSKLNIKYIWEDNEDVLFPNYSGTDINYNELDIDLNDISSIDKSFYQNIPVITLSCISGNKNCVTVKEEAILWHYSSEFCDRPEAINHYDYVHLYYAPNERVQNTVYNGLMYLLYELIRVEEEIKLENPFSEENLISTSNKKEVVNLGFSGGVSTLIANIGGIERSVILDSGASDVSIPLNLEHKLLHNKIIATEDYLTPGLYTIADGSVVQSNRFILPYIMVDGVKVANIECSVNQSDDIILLGKAFLDRFKSWKIDNELNQLILEY